MILEILQMNEQLLNYVAIDLLEKSGQQLPAEKEISFVELLIKSALNNVCLEITKAQTVF